MSEQQLERTRGTKITEAARYAFDSDQIAAIKRTVARDCNDAEFIVFLEVVGRYGLDPFAKQVYAAKMPGRQGEAGSVAIIVGRDGFLAIANRYQDFEGVEGDYVCENDTFKVTRRSGVAEVEHIYDVTKSKPRGAIVGAWAIAHREGKKPSYFFAPYERYKSNNRSWTKYPEAMILKVAEANALRKAFPISGIYAEGEIEVMAEKVDGNQEEADWGGDVELANRLRAAFDAANELRPGAFKPQKIRLTLAQAESDVEREKIAQQVEQFIVRNGGTVPEPYVEGSVAAEEEPPAEQAA